MFPSNACCLLGNDLFQRTIMDEDASDNNNKIESMSSSSSVSSVHCNVEPRVTTMMMALGNALDDSNNNSKNESIAVSIDDEYNDTYTKNFILNETKDVTHGPSSDKMTYGNSGAELAKGASAPLLENLLNTTLISLDDNDYHVYKDDDSSDIGMYGADTQFHRGRYSETFGRSVFVDTSIDNLGDVVISTKKDASVLPTMENTGKLREEKYVNTDQEQQATYNIVTPVDHIDAGNWINFDDENLFSPNTTVVSGFDDEESDVFDAILSDEQSDTKMCRLSETATGWKDDSSTGNVIQTIADSREGRPASAIRYESIFKDFISKAEFEARQADLEGQQQKLMERRLAARLTGQAVATNENLHAIEGESLSMDESATPNKTDYDSDVFETILKDEADESGNSVEKMRCESEDDVIQCDTSLQGQQQQVEEPILSMISEEQFDGKDTCEHEAAETLNLTPVLAGDNIDANCVTNCLVPVSIPIEGAASSDLDDVFLCATSQSFDELWKGYEDNEHDPAIERNQQKQPSNDDKVMENEVTIASSDGIDDARATDNSLVNDEADHHNHSEAEETAILNDGDAPQLDDDEVQHDTDILANCKENGSVGANALSISVEDNNSDMRQSMSEHFHVIDHTELTIEEQHNDDMGVKDEEPHTSSTRTSSILNNETKMNDVIPCDAKMPTSLPAVDHENYDTIDIVLDSRNNTSQLHEDAIFKIILNDDEQKDQGSRFDATNEQVIDDVQNDADEKQLEEPSTATADDKQGNWSVVNTEGKSNLSESNTGQDDTPSNVLDYVGFDDSNGNKIDVDHQTIPDVECSCEDTVAISKTEGKSNLADDNTVQDDTPGKVLDSVGFDYSNENKIDVDDQTIPDLECSFDDTLAISKTEGKSDLSADNTGQDDTPSNVLEAVGFDDINKNKIDIDYKANSNEEYGFDDTSAISKTEGKSNLSADDNVQDDTPSKILDSVGFDDSNENEVDADHQSNPDEEYSCDDTPAISKTEGKSDVSADNAGQDDTPSNVLEAVGFDDINKNKIDIDRQSTPDVVCSCNDTLAISVDESTIPSSRSLVDAGISNVDIACMDNESQCSEAENEISNDDTQDAIAASIKDERQEDDSCSGLRSSTEEKKSEEISIATTAELQEKWNDFLTEGKTNLLGNNNCLDDTLDSFGFDFSNENTIDMGRLTCLDNDAQQEDYSRSSLRSDSDEKQSEEISIATTAELQEKWNDILTEGKSNLLGSNYGHDDTPSKSFDSFGFYDNHKNSIDGDRHTNPDFECYSNDIENNPYDENAVLSRCIIDAGRSSVDATCKNDESICSEFENEVINTGTHEATAAILNDEQQGDDSSSSLCRDSEEKQLKELSLTTAAETQEKWHDFLTKEKPTRLGNKVGQDDTQSRSLDNVGFDDSKEDAVDIDRHTDPDLECNCDYVQNNTNDESTVLSKSTNDAEKSSCDRNYRNSEINPISEVENENNNDVTQDAMTATMSNEQLEDDSFSNQRTDTEERQSKELSTVTTADQQEKWNGILAEGKSHLFGDNNGQIETPSRSFDSFAFDDNHESTIGINPNIVPEADSSCCDVQRNIVDESSSHSRSVLDFCVPNVVEDNLLFDASRSSEIVDEISESRDVKVAIVNMAINSAKQPISSAKSNIVLLRREIQYLIARFERLEAQNILVSVQQLDFLARSIAMSLLFLTLSSVWFSLMWMLPHMLSLAWNSNEGIAAKMTPSNFEFMISQQDKAINGARIVTMNARQYSAVTPRILRAFHKLEEASGFTNNTKSIMNGAFTRIAAATALLLEHFGSYDSNVFTLVWKSTSLLILPFAYYKISKGLFYRRLEVCTVFFIVFIHCKLCQWREEVFALIEENGNTVNASDCAHESMNETTYGEETSRGSIRDANHEIGARFVYASIMRLQGLWTEIALHFTSGTDHLPPCYKGEMRRLITDARVDERKWDAVKRFIPPTILNALINVEETPEACTSVGQVHIGQLKETGEKVFIKVQDPHCQRVWDDDLISLSWMSRILSSFEGAFYERMNALITEWTNEAGCRFDFVSEADRIIEAQKVLNLMTSKYSTTSTSNMNEAFQVDLPQPFLELCASNAMVLKFSDGPSKMDEAHFGQDVELQEIMDYHSAWYRRITLHS